MRDILFRGKRKDGGFWLVGDLRQWSKTRKGIFDYALKTTSEVDSETVGQFTGLTDKNGKKIFEGDIVRYTKRCLGGEDVPVVNVVEFAEGGFGVNNYFINHWLWNSIDGNTQLSDIEVIGNIHDNPELLEKK
jgi:uncharacterized phage protein (TIGR01671 family)